MEMTGSTLRVEVGGRPITIGGEACLPDGDGPDFVVYWDTAAVWDDGSPVAVAERALVLQQIRKEADRWRLRIAFEQLTPGCGAGGEARQLAEG